MSKFTPGPWRAERTPASAYFDWTVMAPSGKGRTMHIGIDTDNTEADARLIAAAPDLLAALKDIDDRLRECSALPITAAEAYDTFFRTLVADAIAKADGTS